MPVAMLLLTTNIFSKPPEGKSFLVTRLGFDSNDVSLYERFRIAPNNQVSWTTVSTGLPDCPSSSGEFVGEVSKKEFAEIIKRGKEVVSEQKKIKKELDQPSVNSLSLTIWENKKAYSSSINDWNESFSKLDDQIENIKMNTKGFNAIKIQSKIKKNTIVVSIKNIGTELFEFVLPQLASDAFSFDANGGKATYVKKPESLIQKIEKGKSLKIFLKNVKGAKKVFYHNKLIRQVAMDKSYPEVFICSKIEK